MDWMMFFAGAQAFMAYLQVLQTERDFEAGRRIKKAAAMYHETKQQALLDPEVMKRAHEAATMVSESPRLKLLFEARLNECETRLEKALHSDKIEELREASDAYVMCKCMVLSAIARAKCDMTPDLDNMWDKFDCEVVLDIE